MNAPIIYIPNWIKNPDDAFSTLWRELDWVRHDKVPRQEYYCSEGMADYTYGRGAGVRTYHAQPWHPLIRQMTDDLMPHEKYEVVFLNGYKDGSDHLGWHADDSAEMDDERSIAIISLGAEREIWFKRQKAEIEREMEKLVSENWGREADFYDMHEAKLSEVVKLRLGHGSLCLMKPHMQDAWFHRIPKSDRHDCGPRISLTFRGYV